MRSNTLALSLVCVLVLVACGDDSDDATVDAGGGDTTADTTADTGRDTGTDATVDTAGDAAEDTAEDAAPDVTVPEGCDSVIMPSDDNQTTAQEALILAAEDSVVCFSSGTFTFTGELSLDVDGVTIRGAGMEATILDFSSQEVGSGANGLKVSSDRVTFEDFQVRDTPGDGIRVDDATGVTFRRMWVTWTEAESQDNGAYGMYPVGCTDVLIEDSQVNGARDAGIYVGQSNNIIVRRNEAWGNVAGIEIENSNDADVYDNHTYDNTAGILVFNLPGLSQYGSRALVRDNLIENNNVPNWGVEGTVVAVVPGGSGIIVLACDDNEFRDNTITGNDSLGIVFFTYLPGLFGSYDDAEFQIHSERNWVHGNTFENNGTAPIGTLHAVVPVFPEPSPDMVVDGCLERASDDPAANRNCFTDNGDATYINVDFCGSFEEVSQDLDTVDCTYEPLPTVSIDGVDSE